MTAPITMGPESAVEQHDELVSADAADGVGIAQRTGQSSSDRYQQPVAGLVTERVVDVLEVVEVDVQGRADGVVATP